MRNERFLDALRASRGDLMDGRWWPGLMLPMLHVCNELLSGTEYAERRFHERQVIHASRSYHLARVHCFLDL